MHTPTALDALARWLVFTLAGVGLFSIIPVSSFAAPMFASARWLLALHPIQWAAVIMILLAWGLFADHLLILGAASPRDGLGLCLAVGALLSVLGCLLALVFGTIPELLGSLALAIGLHAALCLRFDAVARRTSADSVGAEARPVAAR